jgi:hypothetical protein
MVNWKWTNQMEPRVGTFRVGLRKVRIELGKVGEFNIEDLAS